MFWRAVFPIEHSGKAAVSLFVGPVLAYVLNFLDRWIEPLGEEASIARAVADKDDAAENLIQEALRSATPVAVTLKSGKVYVGLVQTMFNPSFEVQSIRLLLKRSGYRTNEKQELKLNVNYDETHVTLLEDMRKKLESKMIQLLKSEAKLEFEEAFRKAGREIEESIQQFEVVIYMSEVVSISPFDLEIYDSHFKGKS